MNGHVSYYVLLFFLISGSIIASLLNGLSLVTLRNCPDKLKNIRFIGHRIKAMGWLFVSYYCLYAAIHRNPDYIVVIPLLLICVGEISVRSFWLLESQKFINSRTGKACECIENELSYSN